MAHKYGIVSSSEINRSQLVDLDTIVVKYKHYHIESKVSTLDETSKNEKQHDAVD